jgi:hypothetical protein
MKTSHKVSIGICDPGTVNGDFALRMVQLTQARSSRLGPYIRAQGSGLLSKLRNRVVKTFLDGTTSDWLLLVDTDEQLSAEAFDALINTAHDKERPVVAGLVFGAWDTDQSIYPMPVPVIYHDNPEGLVSITNYKRNAVFEIDACGTGCVLIHRSVLEKMRETADPNQGTDWCWFWDGPVKGEWVSEDILFCRRVRQLGFPIYVNTAAVLPHQKAYWLDERHHLDRQLNRNS